MLALVLVLAQAFGADALPVRTPWAGLSVASGERVSVQWGPNGGVTESEAQALVTVADGLLARAIAEFGLPVPGELDRAHLNVVLGSTGGGLPAENGLTLSLIADPEGGDALLFPTAMLDLLGGAEAYRVEEVLAHGLARACVETGTEAYQNGAGAFLVEASASWFSQTVVQPAPEAARGLAAWSLLPHVAWGVNDPLAGGLYAERDAAAGLVFVGLDDATLVGQLWASGGRTDDPRRVLDGLLAPRGGLALALAELGARSLSWDLPGGEGLSEGEASALLGAERVAERVTVVVPEAGTPGFVRPAGTGFPGHLGVARVVLDAPAAGSLALSLSGDAKGSAGTAASWTVVGVRALGSGVELAVVPVVAGKAELALALDGTELWAGAVLVPQGEAFVEGEHFDFSTWAVVTVTETDTDIKTPIPVDGDPDAGCACGGLGGAPGGLWAGLLLVGLLRRRA